MITWSNRNSNIRLKSNILNGFINLLPVKHSGSAPRKLCWLSFLHHDLLLLHRPYGKRTQLSYEILLPNKSCSVKRKTAQIVMDDPVNSPHKNKTQHTVHDSNDRDKIQRVKALIVSWIKTLLGRSTKGDSTLKFGSVGFIRGFLLYFLPVLVLRRRLEIPLVRRSLAIALWVTAFRMMRKIYKENKQNLQASSTSNFFFFLVYYFLSARKIFLELQQINFSNHLHKYCVGYRWEHAQKSTCNVLVFSTLPQSPQSGNSTRSDYRNVFELFPNFIHVVIRPKTT